MPSWVSDYTGQPASKSSISYLLTFYVSKRNKGNVIQSTFYIIDISHLVLSKHGLLFSPLPTPPPLNLLGMSRVGSKDYRVNFVIFG